jgi:hypothetical protein
MGSLKMGDGFGIGFFDLRLSATFCFAMLTHKLTESLNGQRIDLHLIALPT